MNINFLIYILIITILFVIYVETNVGNVIFRETSQGIKQFQPFNIIHYLIDPLHNSFLWNISLLDVNYIFIIFISTIIYHNINT